MSVPRSQHFLGDIGPQVRGGRCQLREAGLELARAGRAIDERTLRRETWDVHQAEACRTALRRARAVINAALGED